MSGLFNERSGANQIILKSVQFGSPIIPDLSGKLAHLSWLALVFDSRKVFEALEFLHLGVLIPVKRSTRS